MTAISPTIADYIAANFPFAPVPTVPEIRIRKSTPTSGIARLSELAGESFMTPYWASWWGGGVGLARYVLDHPESVAGKSVLDVGAGSGLVAIAAAKAGAREVIAADIDPIACVVAEQNAAENNVTLTTLCADITRSALLTVNLILAGDVFYDAALAQRMLALFERRRAANIEILVGDPGRATLPRDLLTLLAEYEGPDFGDKTGRNAVFAFR